MHSSAAYRLFSSHSCTSYRVFSSAAWFLAWQTGLVSLSFILLIGACSLRTSRNRILYTSTWSLTSSKKFTMWKGTNWRSSWNFWKSERTLRWAILMFKWASLGRLILEATVLAVGEPRSAVKFGPGCGCISPPINILITEGLKEEVSLQQ